MGDAENISQQSKKRAAGREISRDNPGLDDDDEATCEEELGTFKKASEEVLARRKIVKVRRSQTTAAATSSNTNINPFASLKLVPFIDSSGTNVVVTTGEINGQSSANKTDIQNDIKHDKDEVPKEPEAIDNEEVVDKDKGEAKNIPEPETIEKDIKRGAEAETAENDEEQTEKGEKPGEITCISSFQQHSSNQNAFSGLGTGFSTSSFMFGSLTKDGSSPFSASSSSLFGLKNDSLPLMQEVSVETGEENEKPVFTADSVLYDFVEGTWKERGKGELKINVSTNGTRKARIIMRTRGNYRLILNASIYPDMKLTNMDKKGITFACMNTADEGKKDGLSTYAVKFKDVSMVEKFRSCVIEYKDKIALAPLKTPENSPNGSNS